MCKSDFYEDLVCLPSSELPVASCSKAPRYYQKIPVRSVVGRYTRTVQYFY